MKRTIALSLVLLLAVALLAGCSRQAGRVAGSAERTVTGQVTALDTAQRTITVAPQAGATGTENQPAGSNEPGQPDQSQGNQPAGVGQGELFYYDNGTKVTYQGQPSSIDQVQVGSTVRVTARRQNANNDNNRWLATTIEILALPGQAMAPGAAGAPLQGRVVSVNTSANTFTLSQPNLPDQVVQVSPSTTIVKNGQQVQLSNLQAGDNVQVQAQQQGGQWMASSVTVTPTSAVAGSAQQSLQGTVVAVNTGTNTISLRTAGGAQQQVSVPSGATIQKNGQSVPLTSLKPGDQVQVMAQQQNGKMTASQVMVTAPASQASMGQPLQGTVTNVNTANRMLTIRTSTGQSHQVTVAPQASIRRNGQTVSLSALQQGDRVQVFAARQNGRLVADTVEVMPAASRVAGAAERQLQGQVTSINASQRQLVITTNDGMQQRVMVGRDARIMKGGNAIMLGGIKRGDRVMLDVTEQPGGQMTATRVTVNPQPSAAPQQAAGAQPSTLRGRVVSVDRQGNLLTLAVPGKGNQQVMVPPGTSIVHQGQSLQLSQIKPGMQVELTVQRQALVARQVTVLSSPATQ